MEDEEDKDDLMKINLLSGLLGANSVLLDMWRKESVTVRSVVRTVRVLMDICDDLSNLGMPVVLTCGAALENGLFKSELVDRPAP